MRRWCGLTPAAALRDGHRGAGERERDLHDTGRIMWVTGNKTD